MKRHLVCLMLMGLIAAAAGGAGGCGAGSKKDLAGDRPMPVPGNSFIRQWSHDLKLEKGDAVGELHLRDDTLFLYTKSKLVYALGRAGGELKYIAEPNVSGGVLRPPIVLGERVIYPSGSTIDVFNNRGRPQRTVELEKPTRSGATGAGNILYIGLDHTGGTGVLASIDYTKPYKVVNWELMTYGAVSATPVLFDRVIYTGSEDGRLYAVSEERGQVWSLENGRGTFNTQGKFLSDVRADQTGVYASNTDSKLYCLDRQNGHIRWLYYASAPLKAAPVVTATMVYQYVPGQGMVGIDKMNGTFNRAAKWVVKNATQVLSEDQQYVYLKRRDNHVLAVDKNSGEVVFTSKSKRFEIFSTNTQDSLIFGATPDGKVWSIRPVLREGEVGTMVMDFREQPLGG